MPRHYDHTNFFDRAVLTRAQQLAATESAAANYNRQWSNEPDKEITNWRPNFDNFTPPVILAFANIAEVQIKDEADPEWKEYKRLKAKFGGR